MCVGAKRFIYFWAESSLLYELLQSEIADENDEEETLALFLTEEEDRPPELRVAVPFVSSRQRGHRAPEEEGYCHDEPPVLQSLGANEDGTIETVEAIEAYLEGPVGSNDEDGLTYSFFLQDMNKNN